MAPMNYKKVSPQYDQPALSRYFHGDLPQYHLPACPGTSTGSYGAGRAGGIKIME